MPAFLMRLGGWLRKRQPHGFAQRAQNALPAQNATGGADQKTPAWKSIKIFMP
jgi:hypothetical protein